MNWNQIKMVLNQLFSPHFFHMKLRILGLKLLKLSLGKVDTLGIWFWIKSFLRTQFVPNHMETFYGNPMDEIPQSGRYFSSGVSVPEELWSLFDKTIASLGTMRTSHILCHYNGKDIAVSTNQVNNTLYVLDQLEIKVYGCIILLY